MTAKEPIIFAVGVAIGAGAAWIFAKKKYESIANEEIRSTRAAFTEELNRINSEKSKENLNKPSLNHVEFYPVEFDPTFVTHTELDEDLNPYQIVVNDTIQYDEVIDATTFNENNGYAKAYINYYEDGTFADDGNDILDIEPFLGTMHRSDVIGALDNELYIRAHAKETDICIVRDGRTFTEAMEGY